MMASTKLFLNKKATVSKLHVKLLLITPIHISSFLSNICLNIGKEMNSIKVPYLPASGFDVPGFLKKVPGENLDSDESDEDIELRREFSDNVELLLEGLGMTKYVDLFKEKHISTRSILYLTESDLKAIGIEDETDRKILAKNLGEQSKLVNKFHVSQSISEDLIIAKNVFFEVALLVDYCNYVELQMRKNKLIDYPVGWDANASTFLREFTETALVQSELMTEMLMGKENPDRMMLRAWKDTKLRPLPKLFPDLYHKKRKRRKRFLRTMAAAGVASLLLLFFNYRY